MWIYSIGTIKIEYKANTCFYILPHSIICRFYCALLKLDCLSIHSSELVQITFDQFDSWHGAKLKAKRNSNNKPPSVCPFYIFIKGKIIICFELFEPVVGVHLYTGLRQHTLSRLHGQRGHIRFVKRKWTEINTRCFYFSFNHTFFSGLNHLFCSSNKWKEHMKWYKNS